MADPDPTILEGVRSALSESEALKSAVLQASRTAVVTIDADGVLVEVNRAAERLFGFRREDVTGRAMRELIVPPETREAYSRELRRIVRGGDSDMLGRPVELVAQRVDGTRFPCELVIARIDAGPRPLFTGLLHDLTERRQREAAREEQEALAAFERDVGLTVSTARQLDTMLQHCTEHMVVHLKACFARIWTLTDGESLLHLRASAGLYTHLDGAHSRIPVGQYKIGWIAKEQRPHLTNSVVGDERVHDQEWARREGMVAFAGYPLMVEGRTVGVAALFARHELSASAVTALQCVAHPIALGIERKRIEDELLQQTNELRRVNQRKNEFLATLGHELRNPIQVIGNCLELVRSRKGQGGELETVARQTAHLTRLVDDILDTAAVSRGEVPLVRSELSAGSVVRDAADSMRALLGQRDQKLVLEIPEDLDATVYADEVRLVQVVSNLLHNASKYSEPGTCTRVSLRAAGDEVEVAVCDEGVGIDEGFLPDVFEMFSQADRACHRRGGGLGLGLALARRIILQHGGSLEASSPGLGRGSTFTLRLPRVQARSGDGETSGAPARIEDAPSRRVLVVDDNRDAAESLALLVQALGEHAVEVAFDGPSALEAAERFGPDLILLDIGLPGMDGYEVVAQLRERSAERGTTLVALTGYGGEDEAARSQEAGFHLHVVKPLRPEGLRRLLRGSSDPASGAD